jgi:hypothetical protein
MAFEAAGGPMSAFEDTNDFQKWAGSTADFGFGNDRGYARFSPKSDILQAVGADGIF